MNYVMYLLNGVDGQSLTQGIYSKNMGNRMLKFGIGGKFLGESPLSYNHSRLREIDFVSILNVDNQLEVAYVINKEFKKFTVYADVFEVIRWCNTHPSLIFVGKRSEEYRDSQGVVPYSQYMFGFTKGMLNEMQLQGVMRVNG